MKFWILKNKYFFGILVFLILASCNNEDIAENNDDNLQSGVVITFDDDYVNEWFEANAILQAYDWKATFFVTRFHQLSSEKIQKLIDLKSEGHEIGGHGLNHLNAPDYISLNSQNQYLNNEIIPMKNLMNNYNLFPTSFAYPYGARNSISDNLLLNNFEIIRGTTYGNITPSSHNCFFNGNRLVFGLGIDKNYSHFSIPYFLNLLEYAKNNNKVVIFYAHKPVAMFQNNYETEYQTLIEICNYVKNNNMKFYTISELNNLQFQ